MGTKVAQEPSAACSRLVGYPEVGAQKSACRVNLQPDLLKLAIMGANPVSTAGSYETGVALAA